MFLPDILLMAWYANDMLSQHKHYAGVRNGDRISEGNRTFYM